MATDTRRRRKTHEDAQDVVATAAPRRLGRIGFDRIGLPVVWRRVLSANDTRSDRVSRGTCVLPFTTDRSPCATHFVVVAVVVLLDQAHVVAPELVKQVAVLVVREAQDDAPDRVFALPQVLRVVSQRSGHVVSRSADAQCRTEPRAPHLFHRLAQRFEEHAFGVEDPKCLQPSHARASQRQRSLYDASSDRVAAVAL